MIKNVWITFTYSNNISWATCRETSIFCFVETFWLLYLLACFYFIFLQNLLSYWSFVILTFTGCKFRIFSECDGISRVSLINAGITIFTTRFVSACTVLNNTINQNVNCLHSSLFQ